MGLVTEQETQAEVNNYANKMLEIQSQVCGSHIVIKDRHQFQMDV